MQYQQVLQEKAGEWLDSAVEEIKVVDNEPENNIEPSIANERVAYSGISPSPSQITAQGAAEIAPEVMQTSLRGNSCDDVQYIIDYINGSHVLLNTIGGLV